MLLLLLSTGCLFDRATYEARLAELTDNDGDGFTEVEGDCDDGDAAVLPGAAELCNERDDDCDGGADEVEDLVNAEWFADADADGFGGGDAVITCQPPTGMVNAGGDCDDTDTAKYPGAAERCNQADDDCDGEADEEGEVATLDWYPDTDADGYGGGTPIASCPDPGGASLLDGDCDDADADVSPGATERCNDVDDDCNGAIDDAPAITWYLDRDGDTFGDDASTYLVCSPPPGYAEVGGDCDDYDENRHPGAPEVCEDGVDDDCDGGEATCGLSGGVSGEADMSARFSVSGTESYVARTVEAGGDLDGDGFDDVVVSRPGRADLTGSLEILPGRSELYLGDRALEADGVRVDGVGVASGFGFAIAAGEDTDADGTGDVFASAIYEDRVYLFADGAALMRGGLDTADATVTLVGPGNDASFGVAVALLGDLDGDGWGDWLVGDYLYGSTGAAFLYYGTGAAGEIATTDEGVVVLQSSRDDAQAGQEVAGVGDIDGDGEPDFFVADNKISSTGELSIAYLYLGSGGRLASGTLDDATAQFTGNPAEDAFATVVGVGDVNRDGRRDVALSAPGAESGGGAVYLLLGSMSVASAGAIADVADAAWVGGSTDMGLGASVSSPGDVDGDGYPEVAAGTAREGAEPGVILLLQGAASLSGSYASADAWAAISGANTEAEGNGIAGVTDLNGDGAMDLVFEAWAPATAQGEAWLVYGKP